MGDDVDNAGADEAAAAEATAAAALTDENGKDTGEKGAEAQTGSWVDGLDDAGRQLVSTKGYKSINDLTAAYAELETKIGANRLVLPKDEADEKAWGKFYDAKGRPEAPDKYSFKLPEGMDKPSEVDAAFHKHMAPFAHKAGLNQRELDHLAEGFNSFSQQVETQKAQVNEAQMKELETSWGNDYKRNVEVAKSAVRAFGADAGILDQIEEITKSSAVMQLFYKIGDAMQGGRLVNGDGGSPGGMPTSSEQAQAEIKKIQNAAAEDNSHAYANKKHPEHKAMTQRMMDLHKIAYPESAGG